MENCSIRRGISIEKQIYKRDATFANTISKFDLISFAVERRGSYGPIRNRKTAQKIAENRNKFRPKLKTEIKPLADKASVGFRISLLFNFSMSKLVLLAKVFSAYSLVPR